MPAGIQIVSARDFAYDTVSMRPDLGLAAVQAMSQRTGRHHPALTVADILATLDKLYGLNDTTEIIRDLLDTDEHPR